MPLSWRLARKRLTLDPPIASRLALVRLGRRHRAKEMVPLDGETLNALFEVFADWDGQLRNSDFEQLDFEDEGPQP